MNWFLFFRETCWHMDIDKLTKDKSKQLKQGLFLKSHLFYFLLYYLFILWSFVWKLKCIYDNKFRTLETYNVKTWGHLTFFSSIIPWGLSLLFFFFLHEACLRKVRYVYWLLLFLLWIISLYSLPIVCTERHRALTIFYVLNALEILVYKNYQIMALSLFFFAFGSLICFGELYNRIGKNTDQKWKELIFWCGAPTS